MTEELVEGRIIVEYDPGSDILVITYTPGQGC